jgi:hypothetical protein
VYGADEIDVLAAYVVPVGAWYLFPVEEFRKYKARKLFPESRGRRSMFEKISGGVVDDGSGGELRRVRLVLEFRGGLLFTRRRQNP